MSAWDRLPKPYRDLCEKLAARDKRSPRGKRVRGGVDLHLAQQKTFINTVTRQQRRFAERKSA
jgi:hypothetical protein